MPLDIVHFDFFCSIILRYTKDISTLKCANLSALRRNNEEIFTSISNFCKSNNIWPPEQETILIENLSATLFYCLQSIPTDKVANHIFKLLSFMIDFNPRFDKNDILTNDQIASLTNIRNKTETQYRSNSLSSQSTQSTQLGLSTTNTDTSSLLTQLISAINSLSQNRNLNEPSNSPDQSIINQIKHIYRRILKKQNHIAILQFHLKNSTTPSSLFFHAFPEPFLAHDQNAVDDHNKIIIEAQTKMMESSIKHLTLQINALESNLSQIKSQLNQPNLNELLFTIKTETETELKPEFDRVDAKAKRHAAKPYMVKPNNTSPRDTANSTIETKTLNKNRIPHRHTNDRQSSNSRFHQPTFQHEQSSSRYHHGSRSSNRERSHSRSSHHNRQRSSSYRGIRSPPHRHYQFPSYHRDRSSSHHRDRSSSHHHDRSSPNRRIHSSSHHHRDRSLSLQRDYSSSSRHRLRLQVPSTSPNYLYSSKRPQRQASSRHQLYPSTSNNSYYQHPIQGTVNKNYNNPNLNSNSKSVNFRISRHLNRNY